MSFMKKIIALFLMAFSFSSTFATASGAEIELANPEARQMQVQDYDIELENPEVRRDPHHHFSLEEAKRHLETQNPRVSLSVSGQDLTAQRGVLDEYFERFPETYLALNLTAKDIGGVLDENRIVNLTYKEIPDYIKYLRVTSDVGVEVTCMLKPFCKV